MGIVRDGVFCKFILQILYSSIMKRLLFLFCCLFVINCLHAQPGVKGVTVNNTDKNISIGKTWALIIGISEYQNIDDLRYAHKDAEAFYKYLKTPQVNVPTENIKLLLNKDATSAEIYGALDWLTESVKENDRVIFYFSGHGDVEKKTIYQNGFLLAYDSPTSAYMTKGSIGLTYLQSYLDSYIVKNKAKDVLLIVDACKSGKLAGGVQGAQATMKALNEHWNGQITKILSAQEGELSLEDAKWGAGRGVFSYYLLKGIQGLANRNADDHVITTMELGNYLPIIVSEETNASQNPKIEGDAKRVLFTYDDVLLAEAKKVEMVNPKDQMIAAVKPRKEKEKREKGFADKLDSTINNSYLKYMNFVEKGWLLWGNRQSDTINCALNIYNKLLNNPAAISIRPSLKSSFLTALQKGAQSKLDSLIKGQVAKKYDYRAYQEILYASRIIDKTHILYNYVQSRALYFNAFNTDSTEKSLKMLHQALVLEGEAAYLYFGLGFTYQQMNKLDSAAYYYDKAIEFAPTWSYPINNLGMIYAAEKNYEKAKTYYLRALEMNKGEWRHPLNLGKLYFSNEEYDKAMDMFKLAIKTDTTIANSHQGLASVYYQQKQFDKALYHYKKSTELDLEDPIWFNTLAEFYELIGDTTNAVNSYLNALKIDSTSIFANKGLGYLSFKLKKIETAINFYKAALSQQPKDQKILITIGLLYKEIDKPFEGYSYLFKSAELGLDSLTYSYITDGINKSPLHVLEGFKLYLKTATNQNVGATFNYWVGKTFYQNNDFINALNYFEKSIADVAGSTHKVLFDSYAYYNFAGAYAANGDSVKSLKYLQLALDNGYSDYNFIKKDKILINIKKTLAFKALMKKYSVDKKI
ncbi:tetratricopeptide repeat protein [Pedobacter frigiditerrae]|uniref:tetratricopeptide repeat protein n=1 Tax=Pedobacter frigiditerrae TaxID=2530452 RepID=UPI002931178C|nr:tetratricopeptide repeat protein [Pedobacter frigiditerrae]